MLETIHRWDVETFRKIVSFQFQKIVALARLTSRTGDGWAYPLVPLIMFLFGHPDASLFFIVAASAYTMERLAYVIAKRSFKRKRPPSIVPGYESHIVASDEFSFPSGHTSAAFLMVTLLVVFFGPMFLPFYLWASAVGASRVILGVHFPTDTFMGACLGSTIAFSTSLAFGLIP